MRDLVIPLSAEERLELIQAIAALGHRTQDEGMDERRSQLAAEQAA